MQTSLLYLEMAASISIACAVGTGSGTTRGGARSLDSIWSNCFLLMRLCEGDPCLDL